MFCFYLIHLIFRVHYLNIHYKTINFFNGLLLSTVIIFQRIFSLHFMSSKNNHFVNNTEWNEIKWHEYICLVFYAINGCAQYFYLQIFMAYFYVCEYFVYMSVCYIYAVPLEAISRCQILCNWSLRCEPPCVCWNSILGPLKEQPVLGIYPDPMGMFRLVLSLIAAKHGQ